MGNVPLKKGETFQLYGHLTLAACEFSRDAKSPNKGHDLLKLRNIFFKI